MLSEWVRQEQEKVIEFQKAEIQVLMEKLGRKRESGSFRTGIRGPEASSTNHGRLQSQHLIRTLATQVDSATAPSVI